MRKYIIFLIIILVAAAISCAPKIKLYPDATDPLREFTISGTGKEKVLMIPITRHPVGQIPGNDYR